MTDEAAKLYRVVVYVERRGKLVVRDTASGGLACAGSLYTIPESDLETEILAAAREAVEKAKR